MINIEHRLHNISNVNIKNVIINTKCTKKEQKFNKDDNK